MKYSFTWKNPSVKPTGFVLELSVFVSLQNDFVETNDVAGIWGVTAVLPLIAGPKPALARYASSGFGNNACVDIPALIGTPGNKARTPLYTGIKTHVRPIGVA